MATTIAPASLKSLLEGKTPFALIDVREAGEYNCSHIPGSSLMARRQLELAVTQAVPFKGTPVVVCDDDGRRAALAARTLERLGYRQVSVLDGGINRWVTDGLPTEWGMNVPSKDFGEKVEVVHHVPEVEAKDHAPFGLESIGDPAVDAAVEHRDLAVAQPIERARRERRAPPVVVAHDDRRALE